MDRHLAPHDANADQPVDAAPAPGAVRRFQSADELIDPTLIAEARLYENGRPPLVGDGSSVERREFMKVLGATFAAAGTSAACGRLPVTHALPYVDKPDDVTVGKASEYATTCRGCAAGCGLLVKSREGRPIKVEGNPAHPWSKGGVCAIGQATVVDLYDGDRVRAPLVGGKPATWAQFDAATAPVLAAYASDGKALALVTPTLSGSGTRAIVARFLARFPGARHLVYDGPFGGQAIARAHGLTHGKAVVPRYAFDKADYVLSFGADLLGTWIAPVPFAKQIAPGRKIGADKKAMSKLVSVETRLSLTGSNADERVRILPSEQRALVMALCAKVAAGRDAAVQVPTAEPKGAGAAMIDAWAKALTDHAGKAIVVCDSGDVAVQAAVNVINQSIGAYGATIDVDRPFQGLSAGGDEAALTAAIANGEVTGVVLWGVNPLLDSAIAARWSDGLKKAKLAVAVATRLNETAAACGVVAAAHHPLESWGDSEAIAGVAAVQQPLVNPLFDTRQGEDLLLLWADAKDSDGKPLSTRRAIAQAWQQEVAARAVSPLPPGGFDHFWDKSLNDGFVDVQTGEVRPGGPAIAQAPQPAAEAAALATDPTAAVAPAADPSAVAAPVAADVTAVALPAATPAATVVAPLPARFDPAGASQALAGAAVAASGAGDFELVLYQKVGIGAGDNANNPMLQELPDPISKATWGNYACLSPATGKRLGVLSSDVVKVSAGGPAVELPVVLSPGLHDGAVALAVGYGRPDAFGRIAHGIGHNVYPLGGAGLPVKVAVAKTGAKDEIAFAQTHHSYEHRDCVRETSLAEWQKDPKAGNARLEGMLRDADAHDPRVTKTMWSRHAYTGYKWGMAIDLNACTGCGACVIACNIENNVPVVGKREVFVRREMHWMRIDRYYSERKSYGAHDYDWDATGDDLIALADNPEVVHMPMLCQHCDNAPCETVCPVLATMHTSEGLNAQAYNRCIGTRYCANNCPYKVRRFNWFNYPTREMIDKFDLDLVALALNPDLTKRSRGVMEKCSFCVQRIQEAKSNAIRAIDPDTGVARQPHNLKEVEKAEAAGNKLQPKYVLDGEVKPACAQTCPSNAIVFGDLNQVDSKVSAQYADPRSYSALVEVGTQPAVSYLTKVRNAVGAAAPAGHAPTHAPPTHGN